MGLRRAYGSRSDSLLGIDEDLSSGSPDSELWRDMDVQHVVRTIRAPTCS